jgi:hypothetical protein
MFDPRGRPHASRAIQLGLFQNQPNEIEA